MTAVSTLKPHVAAITAPAPLAELPGWVMWRFEANGDDPKAKPRKVPYYTNGMRRHGVQGSPEDRQNLTTLAAARTAAARKNMDGVGLALMPEWGITALDFDNCVRDGQVLPEVLALVGGTYAEMSPSGKGVRAFVRGSMGNRKDSANPAFGFETFSSNGFVTVTGNVLDIVEMVGNENTIAPASPAILALGEARFGKRREPSATAAYEAKPLGLKPSIIEEALDVLPKDLTYDEWLKVGMALHHETRGEGFEIWDEWSSRSSKYTGREYGEARWASFGKNTAQPVTIHSLIRTANNYGAHINLAGTSLEDFDDISAPTAAREAPKAAASDAKPERFAVIAADQFALRPAPEWIIKQVIPQAELAVLFGESGSGKSFMALDMAMAIARGLPWRGLRVRQGRVVYIAAEGAGGFRNRLQAYARHNELDLATLPFGVIHAAPNLLMKDDALDVAKAIVAGGKTSVVIVDTWAQTTAGGNENAGEDMGKALAHCKGIHRATGATVLLIHHAGKDASKGARGWSGLRAAADAEIEITRAPAGRMMRTSKQKDGEDNLQWGFGLEVVSIGADSDGDPITSCIVTDTPIPTGRVGGIDVARLGSVERVVHGVVQEMALAQTSGIEVKAVLAEAVKRMAEPEAGKRDTRRMRASKALDSLCAGDEAPYVLEDGCLSVL